MTRTTIGGKTKPSWQMKRLSKSQRQNIILRNLSLFELDKTLPSQRLRDWYDIPTLDIDGLSRLNTIKMIRNHDLCMVTAYTKFNQLLSRRGLVIRRQKGVYKIQTLSNTRTRAKQLRNEARAKGFASTRLQNGITRYQGVFSRLSDDELS